MTALPHPAGSEAWSLLAEVWGYDFFGGTRTVGVHVRRLRAKLGREHEQLIGTATTRTRRPGHDAGPVIERTRWPASSG